MWPLRSRSVVAPRDACAAPRRARHPSAAEVDSPLARSDPVRSAEAGPGLTGRDAHFVAGKYVPSLASLIHEENAGPGIFYVNLKGERRTRHVTSRRVAPRRARTSARYAALARLPKPLPKTSRSAVPFSLKKLHLVLLAHLLPP